LQSCAPKRGDRAGACGIAFHSTAAARSAPGDDLIEQFRLSRLRLEGFGPLTVAIDAHGNSLYHDLATQARARMPAILEQLVKERGT
jgi:fumarate hydratase subunit beta